MSRVETAARINMADCPKDLHKGHDVQIRHKTGWLSVKTWSHARAGKWIEEFDPRYYSDKTLSAEDFVITCPT